MTIGVDEVIPLLLEAAPGFAADWRKHLEYWEGETRGTFNDTSEFANYVVRRYSEGSTHEFEAVFAAIERVLLEGDEDACGAATVGVLESVQTIACNRPFGSGVFERWLGQLSLQAWHDIQRRWDGGGGSLAGVMRLERANKPASE